MELTLSPENTCISDICMSEQQDDNRACDREVKMEVKIILSSLSKGSSSEACILTAPGEACVNQNITQSTFNKELPR